MKKTSILAVLVAAMLFFVNVSSGHSQPLNGKADIGFNVGVSMVSLLFRAVNVASSADFKTSTTPPFQASFDYRINPRFSMGAAFSFAHSKGEYIDNTADPAKADDYLQNYSFTLNRLTFGARAIYYYAAQDNLDLYSGLRLGMNMWPMKLKSTDVDFFDGDFNIFGNTIYAKPYYPNFQLILFGGTAFVTDQIGINWELCAGQPYFASIGLKYRL